MKERRKPDILRIFIFFHNIWLVLQNCLRLKTECRSLYSYKKAHINLQFWRVVVNQLSSSNIRDLREWQTFVMNHPPFLRNSQASLRADSVSWAENKRHQDLTVLFSTCSLLYEWSYSSINCITILKNRGSTMLNDIIISLHLRTKSLGFNSKILKWVALTVDRLLPDPLFSLQIEGPFK